MTLITSRASCDAKKDKKDKKTKREFNIVTSGQFCTLAMFFDNGSINVGIYFLLQDIEILICLAGLTAVIQRALTPPVAGLCGSP